jgi:alcohol dehydrogenase class IV
MPAVLRLNAPAIRGRFDRAAGYLGIEGGFDGFCAFVDQFSADLGIPKTLSDLGVTNPDIDRLIAGALRDPSCGGNPVKLTKENIKALLTAVL